jgi:hypothetical protein
MTDPSDLQPGRISAGTFARSWHRETEVNSRYRADFGDSFVAKGFDRAGAGGATSRKGAGEEGDGHDDEADRDPAGGERRRAEPGSKEG